MSEITLYGAAASLYTGRARSYFIKAGLTYRETPANTPHFRDKVLPAAGGITTIPTIETETGAVIRDGAAIIDHYEEKNGHCFSPNTPKQKILSLLFDVIGAEGLMRPAMHYRWNFPEVNEEFLKYHFAAGMPHSPQRAMMAAEFMQRMRVACQMFGAVPDTFEIVESLYVELLHKLASHFSTQPYLFGGEPSIGDFGMMAPLYAHLGRDPKPLSLMQKHAIQLFRWVERMNRPDPDIGEFEVQDAVYLSDDQIPDTLIDVLKHMAIDFIPETRAASHCINLWLDGQTDLAPLTPVERGVGLGAFVVNGVTINALAQPYRFYLLKRVQDCFTAMDAKDQQDVENMLVKCDMRDILDIKINREIGRKDNLEVWV